MCTLLTFALGCEGLKLFPNPTNELSEGKRSSTQCAAVKNSLGATSVPEHTRKGCWLNPAYKYPTDWNWESSARALYSEMGTSWRMRTALASGTIRANRKAVAHRAQTRDLFIVFSLPSRRRACAHALLRRLMT
jgi:hypothetical protein